MTRASRTAFLALVAVPALQSIVPARQWTRASSADGSAA